MKKRSATLPVSRRAPLPLRRPPGPLPWVVALGGVVLAAAVLAFGSPSGDSPEARAALLARRETEARWLEREARPDEAATMLEALARDAAGEEAFRVRALEWRTQAKALRSEARVRAILETRWRSLQARAKEAADLPSLMSCRQALAELRTAVGRAPFAWTAALEASMAEVDGRIASMRVPAWTEMKVRIERDCALSRPGESRWDRALETWASYLKQALPAADREGAERQIQAVHLGARGEADRIRKRAGALAEAGRKGEARALLEAAGPRFAGTAAEKTLSSGP